MRPDLPAYTLASGSRPGEVGAVDFMRMDAVRQAVAELAERWALAADPDLSDEARAAVLAGETPDEAPTSG